MTTTSTMMDEEVNRIEFSQSDEYHVDNVSDLYAVILQIEKLERACNRDLIDSEEYEQVLTKLLGRYKNITVQLLGDDPENATIETGNPYLTSLKDFWNTYCGKCTAARARIRAGHPKDVAAAAARRKQEEEEGKKNRAAQTKVLETAQHFITLMDCVKLQQVAVDQLFPILSDLVSTLRSGFSEFEYLPKLESWVSKMNGMHPTDELNERDTRELAFDMDRGYQAFYQHLK